MMERYNEGFYSDVHSKYAGMMEQADRPDLKSGGLSRPGSNPGAGIKKNNKLKGGFYLFRDIITSTALTSRFADEYFMDKICGENFQRDCTFVSTLRALVTPRMGDGEKLTFCVNSGRPFHGDPEEIVSCVISESFMESNGWIYLLNLQGSNQDSIDKNMKAIEDLFDSTHPGFCRVVKVTDFFRKVFRVLCYVNVEKKAVFIATENIDIKKYHFLQIGIFAFLPWYFNPADGVSDLEMDLINSLREKTPDKYEECIGKIAEKYDFRSAGIKSLLTGFEKKYEQVKRDQTLREIESIVYEINRLNETIGEYLTRKRDADNLLFGLDMKIANGGGDSEIMEYFMRNKRLFLEDVRGTTITFVVKDYITFFDEEMAKAAIENESSYVYRQERRIGDSVNPKDMKLLMTAVFIDQKIRMRVCAAYQFQLEGGVHAISGYNYGSDFRDCMANVHIDRYSCLGGYEMQINTFLRANDYIGAIEQCVASCKSLNFGDGAVMREFMSRLYETSGYDSNIKCFELPDGRVVKPKEAIEYLKK